MSSDDYTSLAKFIGGINSVCPYCKLSFNDLAKHIETEHIVLLKADADKQEGKPANEKADDAEESDIMPKTELDSFLQEQGEPTSLHSGDNESPNKVGLAENEHTPEGEEREDNYEDIAAGVVVDTVLSYAKKTEEGYYVCPICGKVLGSEDALSDHTLDEHTDVTEEEKEDYETPDDGKPVHHKDDYMSEGANYFKFTNPLRYISNMRDRKAEKNVNVELVVYKIMKPISKNSKVRKIPFEGKYYTPATAENFYSSDGKIEQYINLAGAYANSTDLDKIPRNYKVAVKKVLDIWTKNRNGMIESLGIRNKEVSSKLSNIRNYYNTVNYLADMYKKLHPKVVMKGRRSRGLYGEAATKRRVAEEKKRKAKWNEGSFRTGNNKEKKHQIVVRSGGLAPNSRGNLEPIYGIFCMAGDIYQHLGLIEQMTSLPYNEQREWFEKLDHTNQTAIMRIGEAWNANSYKIEKFDKQFGIPSFDHGFSWKGVIGFLNWQKEKEEAGLKLEREGKYKGEKVKTPSGSSGKKERTSGSRSRSVSDDDMEDIINMMRERYKNNLGKGLSELTHDPDFKYIYELYKREYYDRSSKLYGIPFKTFVKWGLAFSRDKKDRAKEKMFGKVLGMLGDLNEGELSESEKRRALIREKKRKEEEGTERWNSAYEREAKKPINRGYWVVGEDGKPKFVLPEDEKKKSVDVMKFDYDKDVSDVIKQFVESLRYEGTVGDEWKCPYDKAIFVTPNAMALHLLEQHNGEVIKIVERL